MGEAQRCMLLIVAVAVLVAQSCLTLVISWTVAHQVALFMGFSSQKYWSGYPYTSPGDFPHPGIEPESLVLQVNSLPSEPVGRPTGMGILLTASCI